MVYCPFIADLSSKFNFAHIVPISAQRCNNVLELEKIVRQSLREGVIISQKIMLQTVHNVLWHRK